MKIVLPKMVEYSICDMGNKTIQYNALRIYAALYKIQRTRKNQDGYFEVPSTYLKSINARYYKIIDKFIEDGILDYFKRAVQNEEDIFTTNVKKYYSNLFCICMQYKFLIDVTKGKEIEVDMDNNRKRKWHKVTSDSLLSLGFTPKISRDGFGRRVHHNLTQIYKTELSDRGMSVIDAKCSQPRLLYLMMKERNIVDETYNEIFESGKDFYLYLVENLDMENGRQQAKDLFMFWLNANGYVPNYDIHNLFPVASKFIRQLKNKNHKNSSATLQREEAKIWIDDLLENLPVAFGLTIHDSLIVRDRDALKVLKYCKEKYPLIEFDLKGL